MLTTNKYYLIAGGAVGLCLIVGLLYFFVFNQEEPLVIEEPPKPAPLVFENMPEHLQPGLVGEAKVENGTGEVKVVLSPEIPSYLFSTSGTIQKIDGGFLILAVKGSTFADNQPREVKGVIVDSTAILGPDKKQYLGKSALGILTEGMLVSVSAYENIRGRSEFSLKTVNILQ